MFHSKPVRNVEVIRSTNVYNIRTYIRIMQPNDGPQPVPPTERRLYTTYQTSFAGYYILKQCNSFYDLLVFVGKNNLDFMILNLAIT